MAKKRILFISSSDFKEKSIQVIRKTPEAYRSAGWDVHYVVGRDNSRAGDYFYEKTLNPEGIHVYRFMIPLDKVHALINVSVWKAFWFRVRMILFVFRLVVEGRKVIRATGHFDVIYGYEIPGVLAAKMLRFFGYGNQSKFIIRFQGVLHVKEWLRLNQWFRIFTNWEAINALRTKADLTIMTNDGSQGLDVLKKIKAPENKVLFYVNGVDKPAPEFEKLVNIRDRFYGDPSIFYFLSVSRLDSHKRIDRGIRIIHAIVKKFNFPAVRYVVLGGGVEFENLTSLIKRLDIEKYVQLVGPVNYNEVHHYFELTDALISMYTSSNVGNPLLEAIRHNKPVITINNGDTGDWIQHRVNGLIYDIDDNRDLDETDYELIAQDIITMIKDQPFLERLKEKLHITATAKLWTWQQRMDAELQEVNAIL